mgnify:CR=1 FL=1
MSLGNNNVRNDKNLLSKISKNIKNGIRDIIRKKRQKKIRAAHAESNEDHIDRNPPLFIGSR